jgi:hypothetical protein
MDPVNEFDFMVIGSGMSGVHAAQTLLEAGRSVLMLDAGITSQENENLPPGDFFGIRQSLSDQYRLWLGENMEALSSGGSRTGSQLTPSKKFISSHAGQITPLISDTFFPLESLARGGLGNAWGLGCYTFSDAELKNAGLAAKEMRDAYQTVTDRIGISAPSEDVEKFMTEGLHALLPSIETDENSQAILTRYQKRKAAFSAENFFLGIPALALLTEERFGRASTRYENMDFYGDAGNAAWRPRVTLEHLMKERRFRYIDSVLVTRFSESPGRVNVEAIDLSENKLHTFSAAKLLIACNVLGTARIVLRSSQAHDTPLPILCNSYSYVPALQWSRLGKPDKGKRTATAQLCIFHDPNGDQSNVAAASFYSYSSLMMFRIINDTKLNYRDARVLLQYLMPAMTIAGIHMPDEYSAEKWIRLQISDNSMTGDALKANFFYTDEEKLRFRKREKLFMRSLRRLGCLPIKKIHTHPGASIHYAGTLPFSDTDEPFRLIPEGRLGGTTNIFIADGSGFRYLPAKGISLSLMANAHRTALNALKNE